MLAKLSFALNLGQIVDVTAHSVCTLSAGIGLLPSRGVFNGTSIARSNSQTNLNYCMRYWMRMVLKLGRKWYNHT